MEGVIKTRCARCGEPLEARVRITDDERKVIELFGRGGVGPLRQCCNRDCRVIFPAVVSADDFKTGIWGS